MSLHRMLHVSPLFRLDFLSGIPSLVKTIPLVGFVGLACFYVFLAFLHSFVCSIQPFQLNLRGNKLKPYTVHDVLCRSLFVG